MGVIQFFFRFIRLIIVTGLFIVLLVVGMSVGGFYLLEYLVKGEMVTVPNLYGKDESEAIKILAEHGLFFKISDEAQVRTDIEPGLVINMRPSPGQEVKKGREITLILSKGQQEEFVPDFTRRTLSDIRSELRSAGLEIGLKAMVHHPTLPADTIIAQDPITGRRVLQNRNVNLLVSLGPRSQSYVMPNLIGMDLDAVRKRMKNEKFDLREDDIRYEQTPNVNQWSRVMNQSPPPGSRMLANDHIRLTVGFSGIEVANLRTINVTFPVPEGVLSDRLILVIWDDVANQFDHPSIIPVQISYGENRISETVSVIGDATISLCQQNEDPDNPVHLTLYSQFFPASDSKSPSQ